MSRVSTAQQKGTSIKKRKKMYDSRESSTIKPKTSNCRCYKLYNTKKRYMTYVTDFSLTNKNT